ncbi:MAG: hypothetical protein WC023_02580 [Rhodocyclaceae bacterium]
MKPNGSITLLKMNGATLLRAPGGEAYFGKLIAKDRTSSSTWQRSRVACIASSVPTTVSSGWLDTHR